MVAQVERKTGLVRRRVSLVALAAYLCCVLKGGGGGGGEKG